jgi:hypothetical protein
VLNLYSVLKHLAIIFIETYSLVFELINNFIEILFILLTINFQKTRFVFYFLEFEFVFLDFIWCFLILVDHFIMKLELNYCFQQN